MLSGTIFDIKRYAINDGPGIRTAVFFKGCPLDCWWCHNPEGRTSHPQLMFRVNRCRACGTCLQACSQGAITLNATSVTNWEICDDCGQCADVCVNGAREIVGRQVTTDELLAEIGRDIPFYDQSGGGVTFTGGEPMLQRVFLREVLSACREQEIHTTVDTSGYTSWDGLDEISTFTDLFLYDLKLMDPERHKKYTSVSNRIIIKNLQKLSEKKARIIVRIPLIPGINDDVENLQRLGEFLSALPNLDGVELMPYHDIGLAKYEALGLAYRLKSLQPATNSQVEQAEDLLSNYHLPMIGYPRRSA